MRSVLMLCLMQGMWHAPRHHWLLCRWSQAVGVRLLSVLQSDAQLHWQLESGMSPWHDGADFWADYVRLKAAHIKLATLVLHADLMGLAGAAGGHIAVPAAAQAAERADQVLGQDLLCLAHCHSLAGVPRLPLSRGRFPMAVVLALIGCDREMARIKRALTFM